MNDRLQRMCQSRRMHYADEGPRRPNHRGRALFSPQHAPVPCTDHLGNKTAVCSFVKVKVDSDSKSLTPHHAPVMGTLTISDNTSVAWCSFVEIESRNESKSGSKI